jgi:hypothetical protein
VSRAQVLPARDRLANLLNNDLKKGTAHGTRRPGHSPLPSLSTRGRTRNVIAEVETPISPFAALPRSVVDAGTPFFEGDSFDEMADKTGQMFQNVSGHHYRGFERLRSFVSQEKRVSSERISAQ